MQQRRPPGDLGGPSRRRPPRQRIDAPVPIPEARTKRTVRLQDVLAEHQRSIEARLQVALRDIQAAAEESVRTAVADAVREAVADALPEALDGRRPSMAPDDAVKGIVAHTDQRIQALSVRLERVERALRQLAAGGRVAAIAGGDPAAGAAAVEHLAALTRSVRERGEHQERAIERLQIEQRATTEELTAAQRVWTERLEEELRRGLEDLARRTGRGVVAVARQIEADLSASIDRLRISARPRGPSVASIERTLLAVAERQEALIDRHVSALRASINSLARSIAWEGMTGARFRVQDRLLRAELKVAHGADEPAPRSVREPRPGSSGEPPRDLESRQAGSG